MHAVARSLLASWHCARDSFRTAAAAAAERHPFSVEDLVRLQARVRSCSVARRQDRRVHACAKPTWRRIAAARICGRSIIATKGAQPRRLTTHPENDNSPEWSRDGRYVYFLSARSGSAQVWRLPAAGGEAEQVTSLPLDVGSFRLAPEAPRSRSRWTSSPTATTSPAPPTRIEADGRLEGQRHASTTARSCVTGTRGATAASRSCSC